MAENICGHLKAKGIAAMFYHAGLDTKPRTDIQNKWADNGGVIVATCAFGMGIDRPDVRFVIHVGLTNGIEDWMQEVGRAGRDGKNALCLSLWEFGKDYATQMMLIDLTNPTSEDVSRFWSWLSAVATREAKPGCHTVTINMIQKEMGQQANCDNVGGCISFLKKENVVKTLGKGKYQVSVGGNHHFDFSELDKQRQDKVDKVNEVVAFYNTKECRAAYICDYFGDVSFNGKCGVCDNCLVPG
jgi:superfamily II DNA helicase RecQ